MPLKEYKLSITSEGEEFICPIRFLAWDSIVALNEAITRLEDIKRATEYAQPF